MVELVEGLQTALYLGHPRNSSLPAFLTPTLRNIIISLARLPLVNSYTRVPPLVSYYFCACVSECTSICAHACGLCVCVSVCVSSQSFS